jgi:hypothetical protein
MANHRRLSNPSLLLLIMLSSASAFMTVQRRTVRLGYLQQSYKALFSSVPATNKTPPSPAEEEPQPTKSATANNSSNTGGLRRLPVVRPATELINRAARVPRWVKADV